MTARHVADLLGISSRLVYDLARRGALPSHRFGSAVRFASTDVEAYRARCRCLKAACRWAWKRHGLTQHDPTARMQLPAVRNERHVYLRRGDMLRICRCCTNWQTQIAIRVAFYSGMRLGEMWRVRVTGKRLVLHDTKNGDARAVPAHPKISHLLRFLPLTEKRHTVQAAWMRARDKAGFGYAHFHDLRHSAASEMVDAGVDLYRVGAVLGHRDSRSTKRYAHLTATSLSGAVYTIGRSKTPAQTAR